MSQRLLLVAPNDGATPSYVSRAFTRAKWDVQHYDYRLLGLRHGVSEMNQDLWAVAHQTRPDLVLVLKGETIHPGILRRITQSRIPVGVWHFDPRDGGEPWVVELARASTTFFTIARGLLPVYDRVGAKARWLSEAAEPTTHKPYLVYEDDATFGVSFIGTVNGVPGREAWLLRLDDALEGGVHVFGSHPGRLAGGRYHGRAEDYAGVPGDGGLSWVVSHSRVNLGRDRNPEIEGSYGARLYRTLAAGGYLLTNKTRGIDEDFPQGCLATYADTEECLAKAKAALADPEGLVRVSKRGREWVLAKHTWDHRVPELLKGAGLD